MDADAQFIEESSPEAISPPPIRERSPLPSAAVSSSQGFILGNTSTVLGNIDSLQGLVASSQKSRRSVWSLRHTCSVEEDLQTQLINKLDVENNEMCKLKNPVQKKRVIIYGDGGKNKEGASEERLGGLETAVANDITALADLHCDLNGHKREWESVKEINSRCRQQVEELAEAIDNQLENEAIAAKSMKARVKQDKDRFQSILSSLDWAKKVLFSVLVGRRTGLGWLSWDGLDRECSRGKPKVRLLGSYSSLNTGFGGLAIHLNSQVGWVHTLVLGWGWIHRPGKIKTSFSLHLMFFMPPLTLSPTFSEVKPIGTTAALVCFDVKCGAACCSDTKFGNPMFRCAVWAATAARGLTASGSELVAFSWSSSNWRWRYWLLQSLFDDLDCRIFEWISVVENPAIQR